VSCDMERRRARRHYKSPAFRRLKEYQLRSCAAETIHNAKPEAGAP
jgi:hypothetical protein